MYHSEKVIVFGAIGELIFFLTGSGDYDEFSSKFTIPMANLGAFEYFQCAFV